MVWLALMSSASANAATLNKCIGTQGQVTYSNLPCRNAKQVQKVEIDPPPVPDPVRVSKPAPVAIPKPVPAAPTSPKPMAPAPTAAVPAAPVIPAPEPVPELLPPVPLTPPPQPAGEIRISPAQKEINRAQKKPVTPLSARQCDTLTEQLGRVFDNLDQSRRKGADPGQVEVWNKEIQELERRKQQAGCF